MKTIPLDQIIVPENRQRPDDDKVQEYISGDLMPSIFREDGAGLINPITLRDGKFLVAGECRTRAVSLGYKLGKKLRHAGQAVPAGHIPFIDFGDLTIIQRMEVEFAENANRLDLPWLAKQEAIAGLHALRTEMAKEKNQPAPTFASTAKELFHEATPRTSDNVAKAVQIVQAAKANPAIAKATSLNEAKKILEKITIQKQNEKLAAVVGTQSLTERFKLFNADCVTWMEGQASGQFDVILTDPPYGIDADSFGDAAGRLTNAGHGHHYQDGKDETILLLEKCIPHFYRLAKPQAHLYLWCDIDLFHWLRDQCALAGWHVHRTPLVNVKPEGGRVPWANPPCGPRRAYELCLFAEKGKRPVTAIKNDVFESRLVEGNFGHGAQKPEQAYVELLSRSVRPGDVVFDAFAGTGPIFPAAHAVKCSAVGVELNPAAYGICLNRIKELK